MKSLILLTFIILFSITACSQKNATKGSFKLVMGHSAMSATTNGGIFLLTEETSTAKQEIIKLDNDNSATIPNGTYNLLFVAFEGPTEKSGKMYCGSVLNAALLSPTATVTINISEARCSESLYTEFITKLTGANKNWDSAKFDQGKWGP